MKPLTDARIAELGRRYAALSAETKALEAQRDEVKAALLAEFARRGDTKSVEHAGVTVTRKASSRKRWRTDVAEKILSPGRFRALTVRHLDPDAVAAAHQAGRLSDDQLAALCERVETAPYIVVTVADAG